MKQKKIITETIFEKHYKDRIKWKDIKHIQFEDDDMLQLEWVEPYYSENNSWDGYYSATICRNRLETDEEFENRLKKEEEFSNKRKEELYELFLKLKKRI